MNDHYYMKKALSLASTGRGIASPNPMVGAVIVIDGIIAGSGYHAGRGSPHAEAAAIADAISRGRDLKGAVMYVTLEPCSHAWEGKTTPPCAPLIIKNRIGKVVIASVDPNPLVRGKGIELLEKNGVDVTVGLLGEEERKLNESWRYYIETGMPFVHLKTAQSLDGKIADENGKSKWISGLKSRAEVHAWRGSHDAVLTGIGTVNADDPLFTVRHVSGRDPHVIILDSALSIRPESRVLKPAGGRKVFIFHNPEISDREKGKMLENENVIPVAASPGGNEGLSLTDVLEKTASLGIVSLLCEGGSKLSSSLIKQNLVSRLSVFISPKITGKGFTFSDHVPGDIAGAGLAVNIDTVEKVGHDILLSGRTLCLQD